MQSHVPGTQLLTITNLWKTLFHLYLLLPPHLWIILGQIQDILSFHL